MQICPACGGENPEGFLHCGFCTASLAEPVVERRKLVTLVFCDLSGSTAMGERVDAETMRSLMMSYFQQMRGALERHGGTVEKFVGDAVLAVFGVPEAHEDDALRACRAALEMQARLAVLNEEFETRFGTRIALRIGVNTGEVVAGDSSSRETFVTGDPVNVAARLEQAAGEGAVLLGESTYRLVRAAVRAEPVEPLSVKGKSEPVPAFRLLGVEGFGPVPRPLGTRFSGRVEELSLLDQEFEGVLANRRCQLVTVVGEPGVGKTRLTSEFVSRVGARARIVRGRCLSYGEGITFWAICEIVRELAGIHDDHSPAEARALIEAHIEPSEIGPIVAAKIAQLLGLADGAATAQETAWAIRHFLVAQADADPLVVVVDDLHWAEQTLLELLAALPAEIAGVPILVLCLARPELLEDQAGWIVSVRLEPLGAHEVDALLESLIGDAPSAVRSRLAEASAGNPLFAEELVGMLLDEGVLRRFEGATSLQGDLDSLALPASLHALLGARLDGLDPEPRATIERAAIEGEVFHRSAILELTPAASHAAVPASLDTLTGKDLIRPTAAAFVDEPAWRFKHILVRDTAYQATAKKLRAGLHEQFADWLERTAGNRATEYEEILGYHLGQAFRYRGELGPLDDAAHILGDRAATHLAAAGRRAHARGDARAASRLFATAAELAAVARRRAEYALLHGSASREAMAFPRARDVLTRVRTEAAEAGWPDLEAGAEIELGMVSINTATQETTAQRREAGARALATFEAVGNDRGTADALILLAWDRWLLMHCAETEELFERALAPAERSGDLRLVASVLVGLARATMYGPRHAEDGAARCESLLERARGISPMAAASITLMLAVLEASLGNASRARALGEDGKAVMDEIAPDAVLGFGHYIGLASLTSGDPEHAEQVLRSVSERLEAIGERGIASTVVALRARALVELGRYEEAEHAARLGLAWADAVDVISHAYARAALARALGARGLNEEALENARWAVETWSESDCLTGRGDALLDLALVRQAAQDEAGASEAAVEALALYRAKGNLASAEVAERMFG